MCSGRTFNFIIPRISADRYRFARLLRPGINRRTDKPRWLRDGGAVPARRSRSSPGPHGGRSNSVLIKPECPRDNFRRLEGQYNVG